MISSDMSNGQVMDHPRLNEARNELYLSMRYLFLPLNMLSPRPDKSTFLIAVDGRNMYYNPMFIEQRYADNPVLLNRAYLHSVLHCMFLHPFADAAGIDAELWNIACDTAIEYIIDGLELRCVQRLVSDRREAVYRMLESRYSVVSAENVYDYLHHISEEEKGEWEALGTFTVDDHKYWYAQNKDGDNDKDDNKSNHNNENGDGDNSDSNDERMSEVMCHRMKIHWEQNARRCKTDMEGIMSNVGTGAGRLAKMLSVSGRNTFSYRDFLRKFTVIREQTHIDMDSFDYGFYNYGLEVYHNMPLIEELEYREEAQIEDFVIVLDTSGSCSGRLIQHFIDETFAILSEDTVFAERTRIHVIQCDNRIQSDIIIKNQDDLNSLKDNFKVSGFGGTDFRPAFEYVNQKMRTGEMAAVSGLIYFTDGHGIYPKARTPYKTAFIFMEEDELQRNVPAWAMKMVLGKEQL